MLTRQRGANPAKLETLILKYDNPAIKYTSFD